MNGDCRGTDTYGMDRGGRGREARHAVRVWGLGAVRVHGMGMAVNVGSVQQVLWFVCFLLPPVFCLQGIAAVLMST